MIGAPVVRRADHRHRARPRMIEVRRRSIILERLVMRNIVLLIGIVQRRGRRAARTTGSPVGIGERKVEAALEPAPGNIAVVQKIADVLTRHRRGRAAARGRAAVAGRVGIAHQRIAALPIGNLAAGRGRAHRNAAGRARESCLLRGNGPGDIFDDPVGLPSDKVDRARRRRPELRAIAIVVQRKMLRVVPHSRDGVAVVIPHHQAGGVERAGAAGASRAGIFSGTGPLSHRHKLPARRNSHGLGQP